MRVCFSVGPMSSKLINSISKSADNVEFLSYPSVSDMIKESTMRRVFFDRIVLSEKIIKNSSEDLHALSNYISEYSDNTKIVLICQSSNSENISLFTELFNSPLYTIVLVEKVTTSILLEFVKGDIVELKAKYYSLDVKGTKSVTSKHSNPQEESKNLGVSKPEKVGFFKSLFSGKKNSTPKIENQKSDVDTSSNAGSTANLVSQNNVEMPIGNVSPIGGITGLVGASTVGSSSETSGIGNSLDVVPGLSEESYLGDQISPNDFEEDILGIGDLGEQHTDTGFLDDDAENEIEEALKSFKEEDIINENSSPIENEKITSNENYSELSVPLDNQSNHKGTNNKYRIVLGERGIGATSYIIDSSVNQSNKGKKVLILDLDYKNNGVLSYIDTDRFYETGSHKGISTLTVYSEDGVDIISNGFGHSVSSEDIRKLVESNILSNYDIVFIDCPLDCISVLSEDLVSNSLVMIKVGGNKGSLLSLMGTITNRKFISSSMEDLIYKNSKFDIVNKISYYEEDLQFLKKICFFGRGDWCSKIS